MCKGLSKSNVQIIGFIFTIIFSIFITAEIFLTAYDYHETYTRWSDGPFYCIGPLQLSMIVISFVSIVLSFLYFTCLKNMSIIGGGFVILNGLSCLFNIAISILILVAASVGKVKNYSGCNTEYKGLLKYWKSVDKYIIEADKTLCSEECPCYTNNKNEKLFIDEPTAKNVYQEYYKVKKDSKIIKVQDCYSIQSQFDKNYASYYGVKINGEKFNNFWKKIEEYFECSGFCQTNYQIFNDTKTNNDSTIMYSGQIPLVKYIFSNFTKGPVKHKGCFRLLVNWIIDFLISFGCIGLGASILQIIMFICGFSLLFNIYNKVDDEYIDNDEDENNEKFKNDKNEDE